MKDDLKFHGNRRIRGEILQLLYSVMPTPVQVTTLTRALVDKGYTNSPDIASFIDYLSDRGYATVIDEEATKRIFKDVFPAAAFVKLTSEGVDVVEHTRDDPGVDV